MFPHLLRRLSWLLSPSRSRSRRRRRSDTGRQAGLKASRGVKEEEERLGQDPGSITSRFSNFALNG